VTGTGLVLASSLADLTAVRGRLGSPVVLVPTMGALHDGHRSLLRQAGRLAGPDGSVVASIFVNPRQFGPGEDLDRYPRTLDADLALCADEGVAVVFAPAVADMYPSEPVVTVDPGPMGQPLEGQFRPGFFGGVLTVVLKLFGLVRPDIAVFGEKDAQQLALVRRMSADLNLGVQVVPAPTFRDEDGLATSSRNRYLSAAERRAALALPAALQAGQAEAANGPRAVAEAARKSLDRAAGVPVPASVISGPADGRAYGSAGGRADGSAYGTGPQVPVTVDYLALVDPRTFRPVPPGYTGPAILAIAARVGGTRLIDNVAMEFI
jgi:pantoate--beta-alanine ligase